MEKLPKIRRQRNVPGSDVAYLLDTNICIHLRRDHPRVRDVFARKTGEGLISIVTYGELRYGAEKSSQTMAIDALELFLRFVRIEPLPVDAAHRYGRIRADLQRRGVVIGANDLWIAAHALAGDYTLVTDNEREFARVPGLRIENWVREAS